MRLLRTSLAASVIVVAAACGSDDPEPASPTVVEASPTTTTAPVTEAPSTTPAPATPTTAGDHDHAVTIVYSDGAVVGGVPRIEVGVGESVHLMVSADVVDHVHVHGPDVLADVGPDRPADLVFEAAPPGQWEIELEDSRVRLADLVIG